MIPRGLETLAPSYSPEGESPGLNTETFVTRWSFLPLRRRREMGRTVWKTNNRKGGLNQRSGGQVLDRTLVGRIALLQR